MIAITLQGPQKKKNFSRVLLQGRDANSIFDRLENSGRSLHYIAFDEIKRKEYKKREINLETDTSLGWCLAKQKIAWHRIVIIGNQFQQIHSRWLVDEREWRWSSSNHYFCLDRVKLVMQTYFDDRFLDERAGRGSWGWMEKKSLVCHICFHFYF